jgi:hypothetical protein
MEIGRSMGMRREDTEPDCHTTDTLAPDRPPAPVSRAEYGPAYVRPPRVVAGAALIAVLASVAVSASGWSRAISPPASIDPNDFRAVRLGDLRGAAGTTTLTSDLAAGSSGALTPNDPIVEPPVAFATGAPPEGSDLPVAGPIVVSITPPPVKPAGGSGGGSTSGGLWHHDAEDSWYGPGFYGQHTACGQILTTTLQGTAHRTLPCGTLVTFRNPKNGATITVPVVDRGPYVSGRNWDLTYATCTAIAHCWTGPLDWRLP